MELGKKHAGSDALIRSKASYTNTFIDSSPFVSRPRHIAFNRGVITIVRLYIALLVC
jgi:hypothetical protein